MQNTGFISEGNGIYINLSTGHKYKATLYQEGAKVSLSQGDRAQFFKNVDQLLANSGETTFDFENTTITEEGINTGARTIEATDENAFHETFATINTLAKKHIEDTLRVAETVVPDLNDRSVTHENRSMMDGVRSAFRNVAKFFRRPFFMKIYEFFEKWISPEKFKVRHKATVAPKLERTIEVLGHFNAGVDGDHVTIAGDLMIGAEERALLINQKIGGRAAHEKTGPRADVDLPESLGIKVTGYVVSEDSLESGFVVPTSTRFADDAAEIGNHLVNCYMTVDDGAGIMRTGVIDTPEKATEFITAARKLHVDMNNGRPLRIVSHQLNSPEPEGKMIDAQHRHLLDQAEGDDDLSIVHLNTPCNRFVTYTKEHGTKPIASSILTGERDSHKQNVEGMIQYLDWIVADLHNPDLVVKGDWDGMAGNTQVYLPQNLVEGTKEKQTEINEKQAQIEELKEKIKSNKSTLEGKATEFFMSSLTAKIKGLEAEIKDLKGSIKADLAEAHAKLQKVEGNLESYEDASELKQKITLFRKLLGMQLELPGAEPIGRAQELLMYSLLDEGLGVVQAINCKSGLDRTGFLFALMAATKEVPQENRYDLINNWDSLTLELNLLYREHDYDAAAVRTAIGESGNKDLLNLAFEMRQNTLQHLVNICMPITGISTGLIGMKWGKGMSENLIPLNCIPPNIKVDGNVEQLLTYDRRGKPKGLTEMGHRIITQLSLKRGA